MPLALAKSEGQQLQPSTTQVQIRLGRGLQLLCCVCMVLVWNVHITALSGVAKTGDWDVI